MKKLHTELEIPADRQDVWDVLVDVDSWEQWNPLLVHGKGIVATGEQLDITFALNAKRTTMKPKLLNVHSPAELRWKGSLPIPGLFSGEHVFELQKIAEGRTRLVHYEQFTGLLVPFVWGSMRENLTIGFNRMNEALKDRVVRLQN